MTASLDDYLRHGAEIEELLELNGLVSSAKFTPEEIESMLRSPAAKEREKMLDREVDKRMSQFFIGLGIIPDIGGYRQKLIYARECLERGLKYETSGLPEGKREAEIYFGEALDLYFRAWKLSTGFSNAEMSQVSFRNELDTVVHTSFRYSTHEIAAGERLVTPAETVEKFIHIGRDAKRHYDYGIRLMIIDKDENFTDHHSWYVGEMEALAIDQIIAAGIKIRVQTNDKNKERGIAIANQLGIPHSWFYHSDPTVPHMEKPDRKFLKKVVVEAGEQPNRTALVGDRIPDMIMGNISGAYTILNTEYFAKRSPEKGFKVYLESEIYNYFLGGRDPEKQINLPIN